MHVFRSTCVLRLKNPWGYNAINLVISIVNLLGKFTSALTRYR